MKRSQWDICFNGYTKDCTRYAIYKESLKSISYWYLALITGSLLIFTIFLSLALYEAFDADRSLYYLYLVAFLIFEASSILLITKAQNMHRKDEYSDFELSQMPPEDYKDQKARYLKFRRTLVINEIKQDSVSDMLEILESRILVNAHRGLSVQRVMGFSVTFAMSVLIATMKSVTLVTIGQIGVVGALLITFIYVVISLKPNKTEQLYEFKYFLTMYAKEGSNKLL